MTIINKKTLPTSKALERAMERLKNVSQNSAAKKCEVNRKCREAIAASFDSWLQTLDPAEREQVLFEFLMAANMVNRNRIATHPDMTSTVKERADAALAQRAEATQLAEAAKETEAKKPAQAQDLEDGSQAI